MVAVLDQTTAVERKNSVAVAHGRKAVSDDENRTPFADASHIPLDDSLGFVVSLVASSRINKRGSVTKAMISRRPMIAISTTLEYSGG